MNAQKKLDGAELLHLALEASGRDDHGTAITYLKQAIELSDGNASMSSEYAKYLYMLGAEYAQIGMMERAQDHMGQAIDMDPELHTARFQLGLLQITQGNTQAAAEVLLPLEALPTTAALHHFGKGLLCLIREELTPCREALLHGIELNSASSTPNLALNRDMQMLLQSLADLNQAASEDTAQNIDKDASNAEASFLMSAYSRNKAAN
jgi:tetratricopeptide (TPR) repeat protein